MSRSSTLATVLDRASRRRHRPRQAVPPVRLDGVTTTSDDAASGPTRGSSTRCTSSTATIPRRSARAWQEFFADYHGGRRADGVTASAPRRAAARRRRPAPPTTVGSSAGGDGRPRRSPRPRPAAAAGARAGAARPPATPAGGTGRRAGRADPRRRGAAIAANMEAQPRRPHGHAASATSRPSCSRSTARSSTATATAPGAGKISFTHLIGYAVVRAITDAVPAMRNTFAEGADGKPRLVRQRHGEHGPRRRRRQGRRHPHARRAGDQGRRATWTSPQFLAAYEDLIRKVKANKLTVDDFQGANVTLTNPGTIGTVQSVPRLMPGQGVIVGVGSIDYPAEFEGADRDNLSSLGVSKVVTVTSTYDHRIIQGAESGLFLKRVHELLLGEHGFYEELFAVARACPTRRSSGTPTSTRSTARRRCCRSRCRSPRSSASTGCAAT